MIISPSSLDTNLSQLLDEVNTGKTQLPEFQRDWTWDDGRICGIIASLSQGYPMGAIMRLQYGNPEIKFKYRTIKGVGELNVVPDFLVLDGQQRLTSIYQSMFSQQPVSTKTEKGKNNIERYYYLSMEKCMDKYEDRIEAVISVPSDRKIKENFDRDVKLNLSTQDKEYEQKMFPVNIIFDSNALLQWQFGYMTYYSGKSDELELLKSFQNEVINTIVKYKLPVITLDKSTPREAVCKVFENVNTGGVPLTVFELVTATYATQEFDLRKDWKKCRKQIQGIDDTLRTDLLDGIDETTFLTTVTLYTSYVDKQAGTDISGGSSNSSIKRKEILDTIERKYGSDYGNYANSIRKASLLYRYILKNDIVIINKSYAITTDDKLNILVSGFLYTLRNDIMHGSSIAITKSSKTTLGTYAIDYYAFLVLYYLLLLLIINCFSSDYSTDIYDILADNIIENINTYLEMFEKNIEN